MSCLDVLYNQTITLFNRIPGKEDETAIWIPTIIDGVHLVSKKSSDWYGSGSPGSNDTKLNILYKKVDGDILVKCRDINDPCCVFYKKWYNRREWWKLSGAEDGLTFSYGENNEFDFFIEGVFVDFCSPIRESDFERIGFYNYMVSEYEDVYAINSVQRFSLIPHFEITAK